MLLAGDVSAALFPYVTDMEGLLLELDVVGADVDFEVTKVDAEVEDEAESPE